jgi:hypothetical protein
LRNRQGGQIGRIFAQWAIVYFGLFFENYIEQPTFLGYFFQKLNLCMHYYWQKMGWATFCAMFSLTHLVTLLTGNGCQVPSHQISL